MEDGRSFCVDDGGDECDSCIFGDGLILRLFIECIELVFD